MKQFNDVVTKENKEDLIMTLRTIIDESKPKNLQYLGLGLKGSVVFGADTETSDKDFLAVFLPSIEDLIVYGKGIENKTIANKSSVDVATVSLRTFTKSYILGDYNALCYLGTHLKTSIHELMETNLEDKNSKFFEEYCKELQEKYSSKFMIHSAKGNIKQLKKLYDKKMQEEELDVKKLGKIVTQALCCLNLYIHFFKYGELKSYQKENVELYQKLRSTEDLKFIEEKRKMVDILEKHLDFLVDSSTLQERAEEEEAMRFYAKKVMEFYGI